MNAAGCRFEVQVSPRASRTEVAGFAGEAIRIRVAAPPVEGAANDELVRYLARALEVPRGAVRVVAGRASRHKTVEVTGLERSAILARLRLGKADPTSL